MWPLLELEGVEDALLLGQHLRGGLRVAEGVNTRRLPFNSSTQVRTIWPGPGSSSYPRCKLIGLARQGVVVDDLEIRGWNPGDRRGDWLGRREFGIWKGLDEIVDGRNDRRVDRHEVPRVGKCRARKVEYTDIPSGGAVVSRIIEYPGPENPCSTCTSLAGIGR